MRSRASLNIDAANAIYVTGRGRTHSPDVGTGLFMMTTVKYEPDGTLAWVVKETSMRSQRPRWNRSNRVRPGAGETLIVRQVQTGGA
jgi:hypothetical protein